MATYQITITETVTHTVTVDAPHFLRAKRHAEQVLDGTHSALEHVRSEPELTLDCWDVLPVA